MNEIRFYLLTASVVLADICRYLFGEYSIFLEVLLVFMMLDYLSGIGAAYICSDMGLDSRKGLKGILKKLMILALVSLAHFLDLVIGQGHDYISAVMILFFIGNEGLSIVENAGKAGLPVPLKIKSTLIRLRELGSDNNEATVNTKISSC